MYQSIPSEMNSQRESSKNSSRHNKTLNNPGSGLLSMLAVRHGADVVYACDAFKPVIEVSRRVIDSNGLGDKVKLIPKASFDVSVGEYDVLPNSER